MLVTPWLPAQFVPSPYDSFVRSSGSSAVSSVAKAPPRASRAASVVVQTPSSHAAPSAATPPCSRSRAYRARCLTAIASVHAACTTPPSSSGTTNIVLRMPSIRSARRSSYSARSTAATLPSSSRARAAR